MTFPVYAWKQAPFLRLITPFMAGIVIQHYLQVPGLLIWLIAATSSGGIIVFNYRVSFLQYRLAWINGIFINMLLLAGGCLICRYQYAANQPGNIINHYKPGSSIVAVIEAPLQEKSKSFRATASVVYLIEGNHCSKTNGTLLLYFQKDTTLQQLSHGSMIVFQKPLQRIKGTGNPAAFNYSEYAAMQGIFYQAYLQPGDYSMLRERKVNPFTQLLTNISAKVISAIRRYIPGRQEAGLAEALLIGYKGDLDKELERSYSNTGVVHIIAISGMHLGLIYWLLNMACMPLGNRKKLQWLRPLLIVSGLWLFALLAGGGPSVLRSAVMFTCIVTGETLSKKANVYNTLAASAFVLLCINPFWLWDVGFQLSYTAVLSIVIFMKPIYNVCYIQNKLLDTIWKLSAVTLAAQVLTMPISIYYFHQFPVYFLFTNIVAVPLSSLVVLGEILLCVLSILSPAADITGNILYRLIQFMNGFIEHMGHLPFALWQQLQVNMMQLVLLYGCVTAAGYWLLKKNTTALFATLACAAGFVCVKSVSLITSNRQQELVVYNIPRHQAIDFFSNGHYYYKGDTLESSLQSFHLAPGRLQCRATAAATIPSLLQSTDYFLFGNKTILLVDNHHYFRKLTGKIKADIIILTKNPSVRISELTKSIDCHLLVIDASNPPWKANKWKSKAAESGLSCYSVVDNSAFVMKLR